MKRGEVWWASLAAPARRRPVVIVQSDLFNASRIGTVVVALVTSNLVLEGAPGNVRVRQGEGGLSRACVVNVSQVFAVERARLSQRLGVLPVPVLQRVDAGLRLVMGLADDVGSVMGAAARYAVRAKTQRRPTPRDR